MKKNSSKSKHKEILKTNRLIKLEEKMKNKYEKKKKNIKKKLDG